MSNEITLESKGSRIYIRGNSFPYKTAIKEAGGHWDAEEKAWWVGTAKRATMEAVISGPVKKEDANDITLIGKATYKGKNYFMRAQSADSFRLISFDASIEFWAKRDKTTVVKWYQNDDRRKTTLGDIQHFAAQQRKEKAPGYVSDEPTKQCWECGCSFTKADARANDGDWQDSYCGC